MKPTLMELAQAGAHFGHHRSMVYPKARRFVFTVKDSVALINLEETQRCLDEAASALGSYIKNGKIVLFVGTKKSQKEIIKRIAEQVKSPYIVDRWLGGFLTNFNSFKKNIDRLNHDEASLNDQTEASNLSKSEKLRRQVKLERSKRFLEGVKHLKDLPDMLVLASASQDKIALREARQAGVKVIAIADTDVDPDTIDYPIPANDDSPRAVELILSSLVDIAQTTDKKSQPKPKIKAVSKEAAPQKASVKAKRPAHTGTKPKTKAAGTKPTKSKK